MRLFSSSLARLIAAAAPCGVVGGLAGAPAGSGSADLTLTAEVNCGRSDAFSLSLGAAEG